jgi:hypothetical protein
VRREYFQKWRYLGPAQTHVLWQWASSFFLQSSNISKLKGAKLNTLQQVAKAQLSGHNLFYIIVLIN